MRKRILGYVLLGAMVASGAQPARAEWNDSIRWKAEVEADLGGGANNPFWISANRHGVASIKRNSGYVRLGAFHDMDTTRRFTWGAGVDLVGGWRQLAPFHIQQAYGEVKYRCLQAMVGQKEIPGFMDTDLTSGSLLWSGNAMPIPQVRVGIFDYAEVWGCKGFFGIKGYAAFGMYTDQRFQKSWLGALAPESQHYRNVLYHSKGIWLRFGNRRKFPLEAELGLEMSTQFGGESYIHFENKEWKWIKNPSGFSAWMKAIFPLHNSDTDMIGEYTNIQGNFYGVWNGSISWNPSADWSVKFYYQHYFDDQSMLVFDYPWKDAMYGITGKLPRNRFVSELAYEFLYTKDQSGPVLYDKSEQIPEQVSGRDSYFTNYMYPGSVNWGMSTCNPLIISPVYNDPHSVQCRSTRVVAHHVGIKGEPWPELSYRIMLSHISSWGTYYINYDEVKHEFSGMIEVAWKPVWLKGWEGKFAIAGDTGDLIGRSLGVKINISKTGWLFSPRKSHRR